MDEDDELAVLDRRFPIELTAWEADMVVRGLVLVGSDSFWAPLSRLERTILLADLRDLEDRVLAAVPTQARALYYRLLLEETLAELTDDDVLLLDERDGDGSAG